MYASICSSGHQSFLQLRSFFTQKKNLSMPYKRFTLGTTSIRLSFFYAGKQSSLMIPDSSFLFFFFLFSFLYCIIVWLATSVLYLFCCVLAIVCVYFHFYLRRLCPREREGGQSICQQHYIANAH